MVRMKLACIDPKERCVIIWGLDQVDVVAEQIIKARRNDLRAHPNIGSGPRETWKEQIREMEENIGQADEIRNYLYEVPDC